MEHIPSVEEMQTVAMAMKHLGDPVRLRIFWILCHHEVCVMELAEMTQMSSPAVSHHLHLLKTANLIRSKRNGKEMYYRAYDSELVNFLHHTIEDIAKITCPQK